MSIEPLSELNLDTVPDKQWLQTLVALESGGPRLVRLACSPACLDRAKEALLALRAEGVPAVLLVDGRKTLLDDDEMAALFSFLNDWDQCLLRNILELCLDWIPGDFHAALQQEARTELKWFQEWQTAANDPQVHKYPSLPWRSFIRRINAENFAFSVEFLRLIALPSSPENQRSLGNALQEFLTAKKKAVCVFPKRKGASPVKANEESP